MPTDDALPETHYAAVGVDRIGYQVLGDGPRDLLYSAGMWSHLDVIWEEPTVARYLRKLAGFCRLIRFDRRGSGLSDPRPPGDVFEQWAEDLLAVLDATNSQQTTLLAAADAGPLILRFVERHPSRCAGLVFVNTTACFRQHPDYPQGYPSERVDAVMQSLSSLWGREGFAATWNPSQAHNLPVLRWYAKFQRALGSPRAVAENLQFASQMDARSILPKITVPTLVLARRDFAIFPPAQGRVIADGIAGARYAELTGGDADFFWQGTQEALALIEEFMTGAKPVTATERILATVLFTDIVDSTRRAAKLGDNAWRSLLDTHDHLVRQLINHCGGRLVDATGDGTLAVFTMPGAAIDCAHALNTALAKQDIAIRAGLHIGELELREEGRVGGMAVHIGARVLGRAEAGEVLVSRTVRDVMIGSSYKFRERGIHELKGVPSKWPLYAVLDAKEG